MIGQIFLAIIAIAVTVMLPGGGIIGGAINGAIGSIVSQTVGVATGIQEKFSWKSVALAFISVGVGGGVSQVMGPAQSMAGAALRGAASSAISQGIGVALGLQDKFSWAAVAAAGVGAGIGHAVGVTQFAQNLTAKSEIAGDLYVGMADAMGQAATLSLTQGSDFGDNLIASLPSVLGGAIGRQLGGALSKTFAKTAEPTPVASEAEVTVEPLAIRGKPLEIPNIPTLLDLVLGGKPNQSAAEMKAAIEAYNSFLGKGREIEVGIDDLGGGAIGFGNSRSIKKTNGLLHFGGIGNAANSVTESIWFRLPGQSTVTRLVGNSAGWDVYSGGDVSFGNLGLRVRHEPVASSAASAGSAIQAAAAPTLMQQRAAFAANRANASAESARFAAGALVDNLPIAGEISGGIALAQDFSWVGLGMLLAGVIPGVPGAGTLKKVGGGGAAAAGKTYAGGAYGRLSAQKGVIERHHAPADSVSPFTAYSGPAIQMDHADHLLTSSHGSSLDAILYRDEVKKLLDSGNMRGALAMEVRDVRRVAVEGNGSIRKYNSAMREMLDYSYKKGLLNK